MPGAGAYTKPEPIVDIPSPPVIEFRAQFSEVAGATVFGWPRKGGLYVLRSCLGIELDFLHLSRFEPTRRKQSHDDDDDDDEEEEAEEEEQHCNRMRRLGAAWWASEEKYLDDALGYPDYGGEYLRVGWPRGGGVWVFRSTLRDAMIKGAGRIHHAHDMEERCAIIEQLGGSFCPEPRDCPSLDLPTDDP